MSEKIGLLFGSFNPVHIGHLIIANTILEFTGLDEIWFVLSPHNPLKESDTLLNVNDRLEILKLAIKDNSCFSACDIEFNLAKPSYSINTLSCLSEKYADKEFSIIMGSDNLESIEKWKGYQHILKNYFIHVYYRPGYNGGKYISHEKVKPIEAPLLEISSSFIRNSLKLGKSIKYLVPEAVLQYIEENNLYKSY